ncbi:bifunctional 4-hydroxy-2-oxoglutarate aldolase/2-dehydro-3-deoxy-phosphogluconate aldolase [Pseudonocardia sp. GCM10023141]|uniref:bifunctional 4-hydroxy-2-oxoglutarate aldolase/2-dehydro-3-deoxy-phosphogluconate aldolase n=1 Tax=Pseudonocardia sp. GCM10023141 TaxID=3252653 RepID=UPI0036204520
MSTASAGSAGPGPHLLRTRVVAILRGHDGTHLAATIDALVGAGITCLEITTNTPDAFATVTATRERYGDGVEVGVGTTRTPEHVRAAAAAGAQFVVSPGTSPAVATAAHDAGLRWYPGAFTATEAETAWGLGAAAVKLFPASLGGPRYLRELRAPLDDVPFVPTGGVALDQIGEYLAAGAVAVGLGSPLLGDALRGGSLDDLAGRAAAALAAGPGS